jgi:hypothetical protein
VITPRALRALRKAAALSMIAPALRVRVADGRRTLIEVRRPPFPDGCARYVPPCAFNRAVGRAHRAMAAGQDLAFAGLEEGHDPRVEIGLPPGDRAFPGGIYRVTRGSEWTHVLPTTLTQEAIVATLEARPTDVTFPAATTRAIAVHRDDETDVLVLHLSCEAGDEVKSAELHDALVQVMACCSVVELLDDLGLADPVS